jgi:hypothetical protein
MKTIKERLRKYLGINTEIAYCLNKVLTVQQKIDVLKAELDEHISKCNIQTSELFKLHSEVEGDIASNYNSIEELESKVGYYDDYDLEVMSRSIDENYQSVESNKYHIEEWGEKITAFTTGDDKNNSGINDVYVVDNIELLKPKITSIIEEVINQYTVSVAAQLRKIE